jgi:hypothetical protein
VFSLFIMDASVTLVRRVLRHERVWQAHRSHYYQRAILLGASHRQLAWAAYALMLVMTGLAVTLWAFPQHSVWVLVAAATTYLMVFWIIESRWRRHLDRSIL